LSSSFIFFAEMCEEEESESEREDEKHTFSHG
jgi:hypothetical protein